MFTQSEKKTYERHHYIIQPYSRIPGGSVKMTKKKKKMSYASTILIFGKD